MKIHHVLQALLLIIVSLSFGGGCMARHSVSYSDASPKMARSRMMADPFGRPDYPMAPAAGEIALHDAEAPMESNAASGGEQATTEQAGERLMTFTASLRMVVADVESAQRATEALAIEYGGHLQSVTGRAVTVRIPARRFREALDAIELMGEVTTRNVVGTDVTETMLDLDIRLNTMRQMRERLTGLLERSEKVEDLLAVEKELQRVTVELERLQGRIRYMQHAIAYSTLTVHFNTVGAPSGPSETVPFAWIRSLERDVQVSPRRDLQPVGRFNWRKPAAIEWPDESVVLERSRNRMRVMLPDNVMVLLRRHRNFDRASLSFWEPLVRRQLTAGRALKVDAIEPFAFRNDRTGFRLRGSRAVGRQAYRYMLWLTVTNRWIYSLEVMGPEASVDKLQEDLNTAARSLRVRW